MSKLQAIETARAAGFVPELGIAAQTKDNGGNNASALRGVVTLALAGEQPAVVQAPRRRGGRSYGGFPVRDAQGGTAVISKNSIFRPIAILKAADPAHCPANYDGVAELVKYHRFGQWADAVGREVPSGEIDPTGVEQSVTLYTFPVTNVDLNTPVVEVVGRWDEAANAMVYDAACRCRVTYVVAPQAAPQPQPQASQAATPF